jgi:hypothetical protein
VRLLPILIAPWFAATACHAELPTIEAIERQPDYVQTRQSRANHLEPKWGGRLGDAMALAEFGHRTLSPGEGRGIMVELLATGFDCNCSGCKARRRRSACSTPPPAGPGSSSEGHEATPARDRQRLASIRFIAR